MESKNNQSTGIGLGSLLFVVFLVLKLCKVIDWSWWWITAPLWIPFAFWAIISLVALAWYFATRKQREAERKKYSWVERYREKYEEEKKAHENGNRH